MHINDWQSIQTLWEKLGRALERAVKATGALGTPRVYVKMLAELEDFLNKTLAGASDVGCWLWVCGFVGLGGKILVPAPNFRAPPRRRVGVPGCLRSRVLLLLLLRPLSPRSLRAKKAQNKSVSAGFEPARVAPKHLLTYRLSRLRTYSNASP